MNTTAAGTTHRHQGGSNNPQQFEFSRIELSGVSGVTADAVGFHVHTETETRETSKTNTTNHKFNYVWDDKDKQSLLLDVLGSSETGKNVFILVSDPRR